MTKGTAVTINFGPFAGNSGVIVFTSRERTVVRIMLKGRALLIELDTDMIRLPARGQHSPKLPYRARPV